MSYTRFVALSVVPTLLFICGLVGAPYLFLIGGGVAEAFIIAKFLDARKKS